MTTQKESKAGHTPTPWTLDSNKNRFNAPRIVSAEHNELLADLYETNHIGTDSAHNAEFIIRAVNSHEALLRAAKHLSEIQKVRKYGDALEGEAKAWLDLQDAIKQAEGK
jgi:hypothetical protein